MPLHGTGESRAREENRRTRILHLLHTTLQVGLNAALGQNRPILKDLEGQAVRQASPLRGLVPACPLADEARAPEPSAPFARGPARGPDRSSPGPWPGAGAR